MATTLSGADTRLIFGQFWKAYGPTVRLPSAAGSAAAAAETCGRKTINVSRFVHLEKANSPISVTESGINMVVNDLHPSKAQFPMLVTVDGITSSSSSSVEFGYDGNIV